MVILLCELAIKSEGPTLDNEVTIKLISFSIILFFSEKLNFLCLGMFKRTSVLDRGHGSNTSHLNPITYRRGLFGPDHQIIDHSSKAAPSSTSKLGEVLFLSIIDTFWQNFCKIDSPGVLLQLFLK